MDAKVDNMDCSSADMQYGHLQIQANQANRSLSISGERFQPIVGEEDSKMTRNLQRRFGKFSHTIQLPKEADSQLISAKSAPPPPPPHTLVAASALCWLLQTCSCIRAAIWCCGSMTQQLDCLSHHSLSL